MRNTMRSILKRNKSRHDSIMLLFISLGETFFLGSVCMVYLTWRVCKTYLVAVVDALVDFQLRGAVQE